MWMETTFVHFLEGLWLLDMNVLVWDDYKSRLLRIGSFRCQSKFFFFKTFFLNKCKKKRFLKTFFKNIFFQKNLSQKPFFKQKYFTKKRFFIVFLSIKKFVFH